MSRSPAKHNFTATASKITEGLNKTLNMVNNIDKAIKAPTINTTNISNRLNKVKKELNRIDRGINASQKSFKTNARPGLKQLNNIPEEASYKKYINKAGMFSSGFKVTSVPPISNMNKILVEIEKDATARNEAKKLVNIIKNLDSSRTRIRDATKKVVGPRNGNSNNNSNSNNKSKNIEFLKKALSNQNKVRILMNRGYRNIDFNRVRNGTIDANSANDMANTIRKAKYGKKD